MSTHNLRFGAKKRKIGIPLHSPVLPYESGGIRGYHCTDIFFLMYHKELESQFLF